MCIERWCTLALLAAGLFNIIFSFAKGKTKEGKKDFILLNFIVFIGCIFGIILTWDYKSIIFATIFGAESVSLRKNLGA